MKQTVCIFGGSGFVGSHLSSRLVDRGYQVRIISRHPQRFKHLKVLPGLTLIKGSPRDKAVRDEALQGCDIAINLIGILNEESDNSFRKIHVDLTKSILQSCLDNRVKRFLHMSALHADSAKGSSEYLRSKGEAENYLHTFSGQTIEITSFRPSVIFGPGDSFLNRFAGLLKLSPLPFPLACPNARFAPVYVGDVVDAFVNSIDDKSSYNQRIDLCGPRQYTLRELVTFTAKTLGLRRTIIGMPDWMSRMQARVLALVPGKPFTIDNYNSLQTDSICSESTELCPTPMEAIALMYLGKADRNENYQCHRAQARRDPDQ
jgi:NADH dehydrogenase